MFVHSLILLLLLLLLLPAAHAQQALSFPANVLTKSLYTPAEMSLLLSNHTQLMSQNAIDTGAPNCMTGLWSPTAIDLWHAGRHLVKTRGDFWCCQANTTAPCSTMMQWASAGTKVCGDAGKCISCGKVGEVIMNIAETCKDPGTGRAQGQVSFGGNWLSVNTYRMGG